MKVSTHVVLQALGFIIQFGTLATTVVPVKAQPYVILIVSAAQGLLGWINHYKANAKLVKLAPVPAPVAKP